PPPAAPHAPLPVHTQAAPAQPPAATASGTAVDAGPAVQRVFGRGGRTSGAISALASQAAATVTSTFPGLRSSSPPQTPAGPPPPHEPPPPYSGSGTASQGGGDAPPEYTAVPAGGLDPRELTEFQLDQLVHRIIGRVTRLVRTELRMDRERIGRLRDPR
ncbi:hypothetical protein HZS56_31370, partial [Streptomyces sp. A108]|nr:hypothetical protein [Streptomyces sp. A108]